MFSFLLPKVTIVIPTYERFDFLERQLIYIARYLQPLKSIQLKVLVLDGSTKQASQNRNLCAQHTFVRYLSYGSDTPFLTRMIDGLSKVDTKYMCILADDDLLYPKGFVEALWFLRRHTDYTSAHGKYMSFSLNEPELFYLESYTHGRTADERDSSQRLVNFMDVYYPIHYAIHRTEAVVKSFQLLPQYIDNNDGDFFELFPACCFILAGKVKMLPSLYMARQIGQSAFDVYERFSLDDYIAQEPFERRYLNLRNGLAAFAQQWRAKTWRSKVCLEKSFDLAFTHYIKRFTRNPASMKKLTSIPGYQPTQSEVETIKNMETNEFTNVLDPAEPRFQELTQFLMPYKLKIDAANDATTTPQLTH